MLHILFSLVGMLDMHAAEKLMIQALSHQITGSLKSMVFELLSSPSGLVMCFGLQTKKLQDYPIQMMCEILKPYFNKYVLLNNVLQEGHDKAKVDLFGDLEENIQYAYAIAKAIEEMGHTVNLIFTYRRKTMKKVNALVLKEEMDRKKADKQSMSRQEKVEYVNNWKKENNIFLCDALGLEDGPQYKFLMGFFISPSTSKKQVPFLQEVL
jgi:hypothetical protein